MNVTPLCETFRISGPENGPREMLAAVKNNRPQMVMLLTTKGMTVDLKTDSGDSMLHVAVACGSGEVARMLLKLGVNPNDKDPKGITPLYRATEINDVQAMKDLVEQGADIHTRSGVANNTLLHLACEKGHEDAAAWLLESGMEPDVRNNMSVPPLHVCAKMGNVPMSKMLLRYGADANSRDKEGNSALHNAAKAGSLNVVKLLLENGAKVRVASNTGVTPLHRAAEGGHPLVVRELIEKGATVDSPMSFMGVSPLHLAIFSLATVKLLIQNGADVNLKTHNGETPLHWAVSGTSLNQVAIVSELIARGSDVNSRSRNGWTPLHIACIHGLEDIAAKLIENGALVNEMDANGRTPMHYAAAEGSLPIVRMLQRSGAKINLKDEEGETPMSWAKQTGNKRIVHFLRTHGVILYY